MWGRGWTGARGVDSISQLRFDQQSDGRSPVNSGPPRTLVVRPAPVELDRLRDMVESALLRVTSRSDSEYEDLVQSALEGVLLALGAGGLEIQRPAQWVAAVARNVAIDQLRARTRARRLFSLDELDVTSEPSSPVASEPEHLTHIRKELRRLDAALSTLGPRRALVVYLHDVLGYQLSEVADAVGTSVAAAQSRLVRGRRALIRYMRRRPRGARPFSRSGFDG
jgi:RNA polymerase sigma-70 factor, ECF subfamily